MKALHLSIAHVLLTAGILLAAQQQPTTPCPTLLGVYPVDFKPDRPLHQRARFEIRACGNGLNEVQLLGFKANTDVPALIEGGSHIELLIQTGTVLVMQMTAGSSSPTLVAQFQKGNPVLLGREDGVGGITYKEEHKDGDYAIVTIPQKVFPNAYGKFANVPPHQYRLKIFED